MKKKISFVLNGELVEHYVNPGTLLIDFLRDELMLTGTKVVCKTGDCGACTVLMDGKAVNSCLIHMGKVEGTSIVTIEGLSKNGELHPLQQAFIDHGSIQCGMCIPGMIMSGKALLDENPDPSDDEIRQGLSGNICRCTGYVKIETAVKEAAKCMAHDAKNAAPQT